MLLTIGRQRWTKSLNATDGMTRTITTIIATPIQKFSRRTTTGTPTLLPETDTAMNEERTKWGGFRPGAGRKPTGAEKVTFCATPEAKRLIAEAGGNMSKFISDCIVTASPLLKE